MVFYPFITASLLTYRIVIVRGMGKTLQVRYIAVATSVRISKLILSIFNRQSL